MGHLEEHHTSGRDARVERHHIKDGTACILYDAMV